MPKNPKYDFGGYATKNDMICTDGRIIRHGAFSHQNRKRLPLVFSHRRDNIENVLGYVDLEEREDGIYAYGKFNDTEKGKIAKTIVQHGDLNALSIFANNLMEKGRDVLHGDIKEVSLVLAGANPGAIIDNVYIQHSDGSSEISAEDADIICYEPIEVFENDDETLEHAESKTVTKTSNKTLKEIVDSMTDEQKEAMYSLLGMALSDDDEDEDDDDMEHSDQNGSDSSIQDVIDSMTSEQKDAVYALLGLALQENGNMEHSDDLEEDMNFDDTELDDLDLDDVDLDDINLDSDLDADLDSDIDTEFDADLDADFEHSDEYYNNEEGDFDMNIFENNGVSTDNTLQHDEMMAIMDDAKKLGSMKAAVLEHGITSIDVLFPDARTVGATPELITRDMGWVTKVINGARKTPFARIKSLAANLTADEARAKGYIKGKKKQEEQIAALKRVTTPQTIYKKQALDRDDIIDITDFDVISFLKQEMRTMLNEEIARAVLIGDGRSVGAEDKINEQNVRPILKDDEVYTIHYTVTLPASGDANEVSNAIVDAANRARIDYKGSGSPTFYAAPATIADLMMSRDKVGRRMYNTLNDLAAALRVREVVEVPVMENASRSGDEGTMETIGIIVNMADYTIGADKGGTVSMFDDFDIDYNKEKYLIETRISGALFRPKSAIVLEKLGA